MFSLKFKAPLTLTLFALLGTLPLATPAYAQAGGGRQIDPTQIRQAVLGRVQTSVGFSDEEWSAVEPKLWRVVTIQADTGTGAASMLRNLGGRGGRGGAGVSTLLAQIFNNGKPSVVAAKSQELQAAIDDPNSTSQVIALKLAEYRDAVARAKTQLLAAQADLQSLLTLRQEALLMQMGFLD